MRKVTGIGGIFFKSKDPEKMKAWYSQHLGLDVNDFGSIFEWYEDKEKSIKGQTIWSPFEENTQYFEPSKKEFMINYRVSNIEALVDELKNMGVTILDSIQSFDFGKFVHILDPEGNNIELWEPSAND